MNNNLFSKIKTKTAKTILAFLLGIQCIQFTHAAPIPEVMDAKERWETLFDLVNKEIQTIKGNKYSGPELKHRLYELYSEKIKLIRQKENETFLQDSLSGKLKKDKKMYFSKSNEQFKTAEAFGVQVIKKYPDYKKINHIYYSLGMNSRDFDDSKKTEQFLTEAVRYSQKDPDLMYNAKVGLAEHHYNNKKYSIAIGFYKEILKNTTNEWYAKHLFNASWCYLKEREFKTALSLILQSLEAGNNPKIVSMKEQILNAAGLFFVQADQISEGIRFYEKNSPKPSYHLLQMAKYSTSKNHFPTTDLILGAALTDTFKRKDTESQVDVHQLQLDIYRENKKLDLFFSVTESLKNLFVQKKISDDQLFTAVNKIKEYAGFLQINLVKDKAKEKIDFNKIELKYIIALFDQLSILDKKQTSLYHYYQAETFLSVHDFKSSISYYKKSVLFSKSLKEKNETTKKSIESILSTVEIANLDKSTEENYVKFAIKNYLLFYPKDEKSKTYYQKLFSIYFKKNDNHRALNTLMVYKFHYSEDIKIHREMFTQILDVRIQKKQTNKIAFWVNKIENGFLSFENDYIQKSIRVLGQLLFEKYKSLEKSGNITEALAGYESIFHDKKYPKQTKAESAFAISILKIQQNDSEKSYQWLQESLALYGQEELMKTNSSLLQLAKGHRLLQSFQKSSDVAELIITKFCSKDVPEKNDALEIIIENKLITEHNLYNLNLNDQFNKYKNCKISAETERKITLNTFNHALLNNNYQMIVDIFNDRNDLPEISRLFKQYYSFNYWEDEKNLEQMMSKVKNQDLIKKEEAHIVGIKDYLSRLDSIDFNIAIRNDLPYNEDQFNKDLDEKFVMLNNYTNEAINLLKDSNITESFIIRHKIYKQTFTLAKALDQLKAHPSMEKEYADGFIGQMKEFALEVGKKSNQYKNEAGYALEKNSHFTSHAKLLKFEVFDLEDHKNKNSKIELSDGQTAPNNELIDLFESHNAEYFFNTIDSKSHLSLGNK